MENFIEKLHQIEKQNHCEDLHDLFELIGNKYSWNQKQYDKFEGFIWFSIKQNEDIKKITFANYSKEYNDITEQQWNYFIKSILNY